ncbi:MAG: hypothetical protein GWO24_25720, partial [Akkermansiaceae bacterium]|nr:hypothetical protein [Akkermansiaceae bacterium]
MTIGQPEVVCVLPPGLDPPPPTMISANVVGSVMPYTDSGAMVEVILPPTANMPPPGFVVVGD